MKISELQAQLEAIKQEHGDIPIYKWNPIMDEFQELKRRQFSFQSAHQDYRYSHPDCVMVNA